MWLLKSRMTLVFITPDPFTQVKTRNFSRRVFSRISGISSVSSIKFCFRRHPYKQPVIVPSYLYEKNPYAKIHSVSMDSFSFTSRILHLPFRYPDRSEWYLPEQCADYPEAVPIPSSRLGRPPYQPHSGESAAYPASIRVLCGCNKSG